MRDVLSQKEIDELIASLSLEKAGPQAVAPSGKRRNIRVYDFRRPDKFSKDQMRILQIVHENMGRLLTTIFSTYFRSIVQVAVSLVEQMSYGEFTKSVANPTLLAIVDPHPLPGQVLVEISPALAFPMVDRLLGGDGEGSEHVRALTEIEQTVMMRVINGFLQGLAEAWRNVVDLQPRVEAVETNPMFTQVLSPNEMVASVSMETRIGDHSGAINLCLPYMTMEPVLPRLTAHHWFGRGQRQDEREVQLTLRRQVEGVGLPMVVVLGRTRLAVSDVLSLRQGDVIQLSTRCDGELQVQVGGKVKFVGRPGVVGKRLAIQVSRPAGEGGGQVG